MGVKQCLFSEMTGVVNFEGKPAAGVKLVRMVDYDKKQYDETVTDENGNFRFPAIFRANLLGKILPMEFAVAQQIIATRDGVEYKIWSGVKRDPAENAEAKGEQLNVTCELEIRDEGEENFVVVNSGYVAGLCVWDVEEDAVIDYAKFEEN